MFDNRELIMPLIAARGRPAELRQDNLRHGFLAVGGVGHHSAIRPAAGRLGEDIDLGRAIGIEISDLGAHNRAVDLSRDRRSGRPQAIHGNPQRAGGTVIGAADLKG